MKVGIVGLPGSGKTTLLQHIALTVARKRQRDYERTWALGAPSPGVRQLTLLRPKPELGDDDFMAHWHGVHGPLAMRIHPIWRYDRNVVEAAVTGSAA